MPEKQSKIPAITIIKGGKEVELEPIGKPIPLSKQKLLSKAEYYSPEEPACYHDGEIFYVRISEDQVLDEQDRTYSIKK